MGTHPMSRYSYDHGGRTGTKAIDGAPGPAKPTEPGPQMTGGSPGGRRRAAWAGVAAGMSIAAVMAVICPLCLLRHTGDDGGRHRQAGTASARASAVTTIEPGDSPYHVIDGDEVQLQFGASAVLPGGMCVYRTGYSGERDSGCVTIAPYNADPTESGDFLLPGMAETLDSSGTTVRVSGTGLIEASGVTAPDTSGMREVWLADGDRLVIGEGRTFERRGRRLMYIGPASLQALAMRDGSTYAMSWDDADVVVDAGQAKVSYREGYDGARYDTGRRKGDGSVAFRLADGGRCLMDDGCVVTRVGGGYAVTDVFGGELPCEGKTEDGVMRMESPTPVGGVDGGTRLTYLLGDDGTVRCLGRGLLS